MKDKEMSNNLKSGKLFKTFCNGAEWNLFKSKDKYFLIARTRSGDLFPETISKKESLHLLKKFSWSCHD